LIQDGINLEFLDPVNDGTPLIKATLMENTEICSLLINYGANVNTKAYDGETALLCAIRSGNAETIKILKEAGAESVYWRDLRYSLVNYCDLNH
jgi:uncharacterized protein